MNQPRRPTLTLIHLLLCLSIYSLLFIQSDNFPGDPGVGWHIATGDYIRAHTSIPGVDPFLHSPKPRPWVADQWLPDVILSFLYSWGGWALIHAVLTSIFLVVFFLVLYPLALRCTGAPIASATAVLFAFKIAQIHYILRPVIFSFLFFALLIAMVEKIGRVLEERREIDRYLLISLFTLFLLWANSHGSFVLGLIPLSLLVVRSPYDQLHQVGKLLLVALAATLINPYFWNLHLSVLSLGNSEFFMSLHEEWRSPNFRDLEGRLSELAVLTIILTSRFTRGGVLLSAFELCLLIVFAHLGLQSVRMLPYLGMVLVVPLAGALATAGTMALGRLRHLLPGFVTLITTLQGREARGGAPFVSVLLVSLLLIVVTPFRADAPAPHPSRFPYDGVKQLSSQPSPIVVAPPEWGGFITLLGEGRARAVIDDRNTLVGEEFYRSYLNAVRPQGRWCEFAREVGAEYFLLPADSGLTYSMRSDGRVQLVHQDAVSVLFRLKGGKNRCDRGKKEAPVR